MKEGGVNRRRKKRRRKGKGKRKKRKYGQLILTDLDILVTES